jgi:hypothetical protein
LELPPDVAEPVDPRSARSQDQERPRTDGPGSRVQRDLHCPTTAATTSTASSARCAPARRHRCSRRSDRDSIRWWDPSRWGCRESACIGGQGSARWPSMVVGLAAGGEQGVREVLEILRSGPDEALIGVGHPSVRELSPADLVIPSGFSSTGQPWTPNPGTTMRASRSLRRSENKCQSDDPSDAQERGEPSRLSARRATPPTDTDIRGTTMSTRWLKRSAMSHTKRGQDS